MALLLGVARPDLGPQHIAMLVEFRAQPGKREELKAALLALVAPTRAEDGCLLYDLHEDTEYASAFCFYEIWRDKAAGTRGARRHGACGDHPGGAPGLERWPPAQGVPAQGRMRNGE